MNFFFRALGIATLWTSLSSAATCVGANCEILDTIARRNGLSLPMILGAIQGNIIDPIVDTQSKTAAWEGGMLDFTPSGAQGGVKVTLWGGVSWGTVPISSAFYGSSYNSTYINGALRIGSSIEFPVTKDDEVIVNFALWNGPTDFGTGLMNLESHETDVRLGLGLRHFLYRNRWTSFYLGTGIVAARHDLSANYVGMTINIITRFGSVGWKGTESYEEKITYVSLPTTLGTSVSLYGLTLSLDGTLNMISQSGTVTISKWGPVGPFFGDNGFYNIGVTSSSDVSSTNVWPVARVGLEWNVFSDLNLMGNWNPKIGRYPQHVGAGIGWKFLKYQECEVREISF
jgi:hypothetical protein